MRLRRIRIVAAVLLSALALVAVLAAVAWRNYSVSLARYSAPQGPPLTPAWTLRLPFTVEQLALDDARKSLFVLGTTAANGDNASFGHSIALAAVSLDGKLAWQQGLQLPRGSLIHSMRISENYIFIRTDALHDSDAVQQCLTAFSTDSAWQWTVVADELRAETPAAPARQAVAVLVDERWYCGIDAGGQLAWKVQETGIAGDGSGYALANPWPSPVNRRFLIYGHDWSNGRPSHYMGALSGSGEPIWRSPVDVMLLSPKFRNDDSSYCRTKSQNTADSPVFIWSIASSGQVEWKQELAAEYHLSTAPTLDGRIYMYGQDVLVCLGRDGTELWRAEPAAELQDIKPRPGGGLCIIRNVIELPEQVLCIEDHNRVPDAGVISGLHVFDFQGRQLKYVECPGERIYGAPALVAGNLLILNCDDFVEPRGSLLEAYPLPLGTDTTGGND